MPRSTLMVAREPKEYRRLIPDEDIGLGLRLVPATSWLNPLYFDRPFDEDDHFPL